MAIAPWLVIPFAVLSGWLYRAGGRGGVYNTKYRDIGCALCVAILVALYQWHWSILLSALLLFGSLTTYWKKKGVDARWWNWAITGGMYGLSLLPYGFFTGHVSGVLYYAGALSIAICLWSEFVSDVVWEESGRGALLILFIPILYI